MGWNNCKNARTCGHSICFEKACKKYDPKEITQHTNADRIRAMSDWELADVVVCPHIGNWDLCRDDCKKCRLEWLKQPAEGE